MIDLSLFNKSMKSTWIQKYLDTSNRGKEYNFACKDVNILQWKEEIIQHAKGTYLFVFV